MKTKKEKVMTCCDECFALIDECDCDIEEQQEEKTKKKKEPDNQTWIAVKSPYKDYSKKQGV